MGKRIDNETLSAIVKDLKEYLGEGADIKTSDATEDNIDVHLLTLFFRSGKEYLCVDICKEQHVDVLKVIYPRGEKTIYRSKALYDISIRVIYIIYSHAPYVFGWNIDFTEINRANNLMAMEYLHKSGHLAVMGDSRLDFITRTNNHYLFGYPNRMTKYAEELGFKPIKPNNI